MVGCRWGVFECFTTSRESRGQKVCGYKLNNYCSGRSRCGRHGFQSWTYVLWERDLTGTLNNVHSLPLQIGVQWPRKLLYKATTSSLYMQLRRNMQNSRCGSGRKLIHMSMSLQVSQFYLSTPSKFAQVSHWTVLPTVICGPFPSKSVPLPKPDFDSLSTALVVYNLLFPNGAYLPEAGYVDFRDVARAHIGALDSKPNKSGRKRLVVSSPYGQGNQQVLDIIKKEHPELEHRFITAPVPEFSSAKVDADFEKLEEVTGLRKEDFYTLEQVCSIFVVLNHSCC